jgi:PAT family beta-lactamase induction signal transducer AmpG
MDDGETQAAIPVRPPRRGALKVLRSLGQPKVAVMLVLGLGSGLPFMLIGNTLGYWLADYDIKLATIGFLSWVGLAYSFQFLWGAAVDHLKVPLFSSLGRRRGWILACQIGVAVGLIGMSLSDPRSGLGMMAGFAVFTGIAAATQDTAINAWRIETAKDGDELGLLTGAYTLGYRFALILTEAVILIVAGKIGWPLAYALYGAGMAVAVAALFFAREPTRADAVMDSRDHTLARHPAWSVYDAVIGPFISFFRTNGIGTAALMLGMITLYHLCDYMRGPMSNPYYKALAIPKETVAGVRLTLGLTGSLIGIAAGGLASVRFGIRSTLILGAILQPLGIAAFALLGWHGGDYPLAIMGPIKVTAFEAIMTVDAFAIGFSGVALVSYMSTLTTLGYTATQYALLTSALAWTGKILKGFSGTIVESLQHGRGLLDAYALFYLFSGAIGAPAILLCVILALWRPKVRGEAFSTPSV